MKRKLSFMVVLTLVISAVAQEQAGMVSGPKTKGSTTTPSIPVVIRGGTHPGSQSEEGEARFTRNFVMSPSSSHEIYLTFSLATLAKALGAEQDAFALALGQWLYIVDAKEGVMEDGMICCLTDDVPDNYYNQHRGIFMLDPDGRTPSVVDKPETPVEPSDTLAIMNGEPDAGVSHEQEVVFGEKTLLYVFESDSLAQSPDMKLRIINIGDGFKEGDLCHAEFALRYNEKTVTFDISVLISVEERGMAIPLTTFYKVGEQVLDADIALERNTYANISYVGTIPVDLGSVCNAFGGDVGPEDLGLYVMTDYNKQLLTDYFSYHHTSFVTLDIEGLETLDYSSGLYYGFRYVPMNSFGQQGFELMYKPADFVGGEQTSGSVFLVADGKYYEFVLNMRFGVASDEVPNFDVIETSQIDVRLMDTRSNYTYMTEGDTIGYSLVTTPLDMAHYAEVLGTETFLLYAEQIGHDGIGFTRKYTASPGQGFWLKAEDRGSYATSSQNEANIGFYLSDGALRWYESPNNIKVGDKYTTNLYLVNKKKNTAVKLEVDISIEERLDNVVSYVVRRLPYGMAGGRDATNIATINHVQSTHSATIYNLQGQQLNAPRQGINIVDGKKVLVK